MSYKVINETMNIINRGIVLILDKYDTDIKLHDNIILYDDNYNIVSEAIVKGIEKQGNKNMAININGRLESVRDAKYYKIV